MDGFACWSNRNSDLDLLAPGYQITTIALGGGFTSSFAGTSLSAPMVAGAVALMLDKNSTLTPSEIKDILVRTGVNITDTETITVLNYSLEANIAANKEKSKDAGT